MRPEDEDPPPRPKAKPEPTPEIARVWARFVDKTSGAPLSGERYRARLLDQDLLRDDQLGESWLSGVGEAEFMFPLSDFRGLDTLTEDRPDLYVVLLDQGREVFRSAVSRDVDFLSRDPVTGRWNQLTQDLGTFRV